MSLQIVYPFTTPANYEFDSDLIEVVDGKAKLKLVDNIGLTFEFAHKDYNLIAARNVPDVATKNFVDLI